MFWTGLYLYRSWFAFDWYRTKTIILWYDINDLAKTAFLFLIHFASAVGWKIVFSCKCQQKECSSGWTVHYLTIGKVSKCRDFTVLWLVQKIDHWLELTSSITFIWLLVPSKRTVPRTFRGKYAASFSVTLSITSIMQSKCSNIQYPIRLILYVVLYYVFNYAFNIQLIFNIQRVIQYSTSHSTFNYSFYIQFLIHPFNYLFNNFNHLFNIQL